MLLLSHFSRVRLCTTSQMAAHQALLTLGFSRQEHWSGLPFPSPSHKYRCVLETTLNCLHYKQVFYCLKQFYFQDSSYDELEISISCLNSILGQGYHRWETTHINLKRPKYITVINTSAFRCLYFSFSPLLFASFLFTAICKASSDSHFAFVRFFSMGMVLIPISCTMSQTSVHSSAGTLSGIVP